MRLKTGTYTGNGSDNRAITGLGFQPTLVWIKPKDTTANDGAMSWDALGSDKSFDPNGSSTPSADMIQSFDSDGFTIGTAANVNTNGVDYVWVAMAADSSHIFTGTYTGNGTTSKIVSGVGFEPDLVIVKRNGSSQGGYYWSFGDYRYSWTSNNGASGVMINNSDGFELLSTSSTLNSSGSTYYYFCLKFDSAWGKMASYTGNGTDNNAITGLGFAPDLVWIKATSASQAAAFRTRDGHSGDSSTAWVPSVADAANVIQSLDSDGFTIGTSTLVNNNAISYRYFALRDSKVTQTKSLTYRIKKTYSTTKSLTYRIKKGIPVTKQLKYTVKKGVTATKSLTYRIKKTRSTTKSLTYRIKKSRSNTKSLTYRIEKPRQITKSLTYVIAQTAVEVVITKQLRYSIKKAYTRTLSLTYVVAYTPPGYSKQTITLLTKNEPKVLQLQSRITVLQSKQQDRITLN